MISIVPLAQILPDEVETLLDDAFGADRHSRTAYRLRAGTSAIAALSFAAVTGTGSLIGSIQCWPVRLSADDGTQHALTLVGPVAVRPALQRGGTGRALMTRMLSAAQTCGADVLVMIGDPEYYGRFFGFSADATAGWRVPGPVERHRLLARLTPPREIAASGDLGPAL